MAFLELFLPTRSSSPVPLFPFFSHTVISVSQACLIYVWGNDFSVARLGQGAFRIALEAVYSKLTGKDLHALTFGKPELSTYEYANGLLQDMLQSSDTDISQPMAPENVWMIGDNPYSDIAGTLTFLNTGANNFGWSSALVRTGVYRDIEGPPAHKPTLVMDNVEIAVRTIMKNSWS